jgi:hypothetical protein
MPCTSLGFAWVVAVGDVVVVVSDVEVVLESGVVVDVESVGAVLAFVAAEPDDGSVVAVDVVVDVVADVSTTQV